MLFSLAITTGGFFVFQSYKKAIRSDKQNELGGIAELKTGQLVHWMDERKGDAQILISDPLFVAEVERWFRQGGEPGEIKSRLLERLDTIQHTNAAFGYTSISLLDADGRLRLSTSAEESHAQIHEKERVLQSMRDGRIYLSDIHVGKFGNKDVLETDLVAPLSVGKGNKAHPIGVVLFHIDPDRFIFPLIQHWPTPSASAENLIVRRYGDDVLFLNQLRHRKNTPLVMHLPLSQQQLLASKAVMGYEGLAEGVDYRGVPVIGVLSRVAGTPWFMISKIDKAEIDAPINRLGDWMLLLMLALVGTGGGIAVFWWKREKEQHESELEHQRLVKHLDYLSKYANDIIMLVDERGKIIDVNDRALEAYGYTTDEFLKMTIYDLRDVDCAQQIDEDFRKVHQFGALRFESTHMRKNRQYFPVEVSVRVVDIDGKRFQQAIIRDITERSKAQQELARQKSFIRQVIDSDPNLIFVKDADGCILLANEAMAKSYGQTTEGIVGKHSSDFVSNPAQVAAYEHANREVLESRQDRVAIENGVPVDGACHWFQTIRKPLELADGNLCVLTIATDITELKATEERLKVEHNRLRTLLKTIPDLVWLKDTEGLYLSCNPQFERYFGAKEAAIIGKTDYDFVDAELADHFRSKDRDALSAGRPLMNEEWITYPDNGQRVLLETIKAPMWDELGQQIGVMGIARDITERKRAEERESRLRHILDSTLDMIFIFRSDTLKFIYMNKGALDSIGYSFDELLSMTPSDIEPLLPETEFRKLLAPLVAGRKEMLRFETTHRCKDGTDLPVEVQLQLVKESSGEQVFVAIVRDIAERRRAEKELQGQKVFMWQVIDADPNRIFVKDAEGRFLLVNRSVADAHGLMPNDMIGKSLAELDRSPEGGEGYLEVDRRVIEEGREVSVTEPYRLHNGEQRWLHTIKKRLVMPDGRISVLGIAMDITQQKLSEIKLSESYKELQQLSLHLENVRADERIRIARNLHDEMGAMLVAIKMGIVWLASKLPKDMPELAVETANITELVAEGIRILHQIVTELRPNLLADVGLAAAIKDYVNKFRQRMNIDCVLALPEEEFELNEDQSLTVFRILQEALNNVAKHAQAGKVTISFMVRGDSLLMVVRDNGIGFDPSMRRENAFGLLGIRERALMVGGRARISSAPYRGTRVSVSIPYAAAKRGV